MDDAKLSVVTGPFKGKVFTINKDQMVIGRDPKCEVYISVQNISRAHAKIVRAGDKYQIEDMDSRNGTFVNDQRVSIGDLVDGDRIVLGGYMLAFHISEGTIDSSPSSFNNTKTQNIMINTQEREFFSGEGGVEELKKSKEKLAGIYKISQKLTSELDLDILYDKTIEAIMEEIHIIDFCSILLVLEKNELSCEASRYRDVSKRVSARKTFSKTILKSVLDEKKALLINDPQEDDRFENSNSLMNLDLRSTICAPLQNNNKILGIIQVNTSSVKDRFSEDDLEFISALGFLVGSYIENAMLYNQLSEEKEALKNANKKLKLAQDSLIQSEKLAAVGQLSAGIVHDIKNPMTVIKGHSKLLQEIIKGTEHEEVDGFNILTSLVSIEEGTTHCNDILNQMLQFARQKPPEMILSNLNDVIAETTSFLSYEINKNRAIVNTNFSDELDKVKIDPSQIKQILINMIINGMQACEEKPLIEITTEQVLVADKFYARLLIRDNGTGMPDDVKNKIFEPFFTTKEAGEGLGGSGMGLSVAYGIIQNHSGKINVESELGLGTTFIIDLPLTKN